MPLVKTTAIILRSRKWGEADRIITVYSKNLGKIRGVARGARRQKSRFGGAIEPFSVCRLNLFEKAGDSLFRISHVDLVRSSQVLREDLRLMASAARMVNVVAAITPDGDPDPLLFDTLEQGLAALPESEDSTFTALLFQIRLLGLTGFRPQTDQCAACGKTFRRGTSFFSDGRRSCMPDLYRTSTNSMCRILTRQSFVSPASHSTGSYATPAVASYGASAE